MQHRIKHSLHFFNTAFFLPYPFALLLDSWLVIPALPPPFVSFTARSGDVAVGLVHVGDTILSRHTASGELR